MNLREKADKVRQALDLLVGHHDAPKAEIEAELKEIAAYASAKLKNVDGERKEYEARRAEQSAKVRAAANRAAGKAN